MQFAGQRTDMQLTPIGEPINVLVALTDEVLPDPQAILITGITPQQTRGEGQSEADFVKLLHDKVFTPSTIIMGFNSVRFDDEFMRYTLYRNLHDPYEWQWKDDRSRWDLLDVVRMTRALRPEGITWPTDTEGQPTNRLELLTQANQLAHVQAHDALSDVMALIAVAKLIKTRQPKLFDYLFSMRTKQDVAGLVNLDNPQPFVYSSGRYPKTTLHTTVALPIAPGGKPGSVVVYDLRHDPRQWADKAVAELQKIRSAPYEARRAKDFLPLPAKELAYNRCPAVAPLGVLDEAAQARIGLDLATVQQNLDALKKTDLPQKLGELFAKPGDFPPANDVDARLYDGFVNNSDKTKMAVVRAADAAGLADLHPDFSDERLHQLLTRYKARNYPQSLAADERELWESHRAERLAKDMPRYAQELARLGSEVSDGQKRFILQELHLWAESIAPL